MKRKMLIILLLIFVLIAASACAFLRQPQFGKQSSGERLERIKNSPNYKDGQFQNTMFTPNTINFRKAMGEMFSRRKNQARPKNDLPTVKTDLKAISPDEDMFVWFGHSSYLLQINGKKFLIDPVLSNSASPVSFMNKSFKGTNIYSPDDLPDIDYLLITHDHWDHLDYKTVKAIRDKTDTVICPLGVGAHFERWGYDAAKIIEKDWNETFTIANNITVNTVESRHFSGRTFKRNTSLWSSYVLQTPDLTLFLGGDGGYGDHFVKIGEKFGPFDLAFLENGQYSDLWKYIHATPQQTAQIAQELNAKQIMPIHSSKFSMSSAHDWDEPLRLITSLGDSIDLRVLTPKIGELVHFKDTTQVFEHWWEGLK